ncbi:hypothetical protein AAKU61_001601 [Undibacterium sp. GrIS 1.2]|uniref:hypothetical protein n=1 Tax=Undibacterium sp. GrIS 1.2 TaxID=3143933 RepID=UPI0033938FD3
MINQKQSGSMSLWTISFLMMLLTAVGLSVLYMARYGELPFPQARARWSKSANVISTELKNASGMQSSVSSQDTSSTPNANIQQAVTIDAGVRRCTVNGKTVYSDTLCLDNNPTTKTLKLHDNKSDAPKAPASAVDSNDLAGQDLREKILSKMLK